MSTPRKNEMADALELAAARCIPYYMHHQEKQWSPFLCCCLDELVRTGEVSERISNELQNMLGELLAPSLCLESWLVNKLGVEFDYEDHEQMDRIFNHRIEWAHKLAQELRDGVI